MLSWPRHETRVGFKKSLYCSEKPVYDSFAQSTHPGSRCELRHPDRPEADDVGDGFTFTI